MIEINEKILFKSIFFSLGFISLYPMDEAQKENGPSAQKRVTFSLSPETLPVKKLNPFSSPPDNRPSSRTLSSHTEEKQNGKVEYLNLDLSFNSLHDSKQIGIQPVSKKSISGSSLDIKRGPESSPGPEMRWQGSSKRINFSQSLSPYEIGCGWLDEVDELRAYKYFQPHTYPAGQACKLIQWAEREKRRSIPKENTSRFLALLYLSEDYTKNLLIQNPHVAGLRKKLGPAARQMLFSRWKCSDLESALASLDMQDLCDSYKGKKKSFIERCLPIREEKSLAESIYNSLKTLVESKKGCDLKNKVSADFFSMEEIERFLQRIREKKSFQKEEKITCLVTDPDRQGILYPYYFEVESYSHGLTGLLLASSSSKNLKELMHEHWKIWLAQRFIHKGGLHGQYKKYLEGLSHHFKKKSFSDIELLMNGLSFLQENYKKEFLLYQEEKLQKIENELGTERVEKDVVWSLFFNPDQKEEEPEKNVLSVQAYIVQELKKLVKSK